MKKIDTIREVLEFYAQGDWNGDPAKKALDALSTIEADAKPQEPSGDAEAFCKRHQYLMSPKIIQAHDDAIRREAVSKAIEYIDSNHNDGLQWDRHDFDALRAAILGTEPAREES